MLQPLRTTAGRGEALKGSLDSGDLVVWIPGCRAAAGGFGLRLPDDRLKVERPIVGRWHESHTTQDTVPIERDASRPFQEGSDPGSDAIGVPAKEFSSGDVEEMAGPFMPLPFTWAERRDRCERPEPRRRGRISASIDSNQAGWDTQPTDEKAPVIVGPDHHFVDVWHQQPHRPSVDC
jgi:hypothetical protein